MNFDKLKPAWEQFKFLQHFNPITEAEILTAIGTMEPISAGRKQAAVRVLQQVIIGLFLIFCCRGG